MELTQYSLACESIEVYNVLIGNLISPQTVCVCMLGLTSQYLSAKLQRKVSELRVQALSHQHSCLSEQDWNGIFT